MIPIFNCGYGGFNCILKLIKKKEEKAKEKEKDKKLI